MIYNTGIQRVISTKSVKPALQLAYVKLMMDVIGRGLVMASQVDEEIKQEVGQPLSNFVLSMKVFPNGPAFVAKVTADHQLELLQNTAQTRFNHYLQTLKSCIFSVFISGKYRTGLCA